MATRSSHYDEAIALFRSAGKVSPSFLARRLGISLTASYAIVGQLERDGLVTRQRADGHRDVTVDIVAGHYDPSADAVQ
ncbi:MAG: hypothetical protein DI498_10965 [Paracoccus denitrificans]|nr:MAG: hypothetical protein DI498_10965 [Paracoccus denitrificans]PZO83662.1 MAG: hypothetical protein DI633_10965 [Paracoccus denitrificans]